MRDLTWQHYLCKWYCEINVVVVVIVHVNHTGNTTHDFRLCHHLIQPRCSSLRSGSLGFLSFLSTPANPLVVLLAMMDRATKAFFLAASQHSPGTKVSWVFFCRAVRPIFFVSQLQSLVHSMAHDCFHSPLFCIQLRAVLLSSQNLTPSNLTRDCNGFFTVCMSRASILADINSKCRIESSFRGATLILLATYLTWALPSFVRYTK